ncbi:hypothetical protein DL93DRAFT_2069160, partial [Clavulina sp. PMI_390]
MIRSSDEITGLEIKTGLESARHALIALFADDATVFLSKNDKPSSLWRILDLWCDASGAKFNKPKTVAIPVGSKAYRKQLIESGKLNPTHNDTERLDLFGIMNILHDGEATRILGAFLGNHVSNEHKWPEIVERITAALDRWNNHHPTMIGRRIITQITVGGMTQFLARAQGMPDKIKKQLHQITWRFIWNTPTGPPPIKNEMLYAPITAGGMGALDILSRSEALDLIRLQQMINTDPRRPLATDAANAVIYESLPTSERKNVPPRTRSKFFLQNVYKREKYTARRLPEDIRQMLNTSKKHDVYFNALQLSNQHKLELPVWHH